MPTALGTFRLRVYDGARGDGPIAIIAGDAFRSAPPRIHRACFLAENLGHTGCDCRERLSAALETIAARGGVVVYLRRDADGRGVAEQLRNRVGADHQLLDAASVEIAEDVLRDLGVEAMRRETCDGRSSM